MYELYSHHPPRVSPSQEAQVNLRCPPLVQLLHYVRNTGVSRRTKGMTLSGTQSPWQGRAALPLFTTVSLRNDVWVPSVHLAELVLSFWLKI